MALGEAVRAAGIGCRTGATADEVLAAIDAALGTARLRRADLGVIAVPPQKTSEASIADAAATLGLPLVVVTQDELEQACARGLSRSAASLAATGVPSACEAAALAAAGVSSQLLAPRTITARVTCAIAESSS